MPNTATYNLTIDLATGEIYRLTSAGESFDVQGNSNNSFKPASFEVTRNLSSKQVKFTIPRLDDANGTLTFAMTSDTIQTDARVRYSIVVDNVERVLLYGRVSEVTTTESVLDITVSSFLENLKYGRVKKVSNICRNRFGDSNCQFDLSTVTFPFVVDEVAPDRLSATMTTALTPQQFQDGFIELPFPGGRNLRTDIAVNDETTVFFWEKLPEFFNTGSTMNLIQGCLKTAGACRQYNNFVNFGAVPSEPNWSPTLLQNIAGAAS